MKISSINPSFQGRRDNIDAVINLDDRNIKQLAAIKTEQENNFDQKRKIAKGLIYATPIAAGVSHAMLTKTKQTKIFSKQVKGLAAKIAQGMKVGAGWAAGIAAIELLNTGLRGLRKHSDTYKNFDDRHPLISTMTNVAAGFGLLNLIGRGSAKLGEMKAPEFMQNLTVKTNKFLNKNETVKQAQKFISENIAVLPKSLKSIGKYAAFWSPETLLLSGIIYGTKASNKAHKEYNKNYSELKEVQSNLAQARVRELALQNDFLMQDAQNQEDLELLDNPIKGLPQDVAEQIDELHEDV